MNFWRTSGVAVTVKGARAGGVPYCSRSRARLAIGLPEDAGVLLSLDAKVVGVCDPDSLLIPLPILEMAEGVTLPFISKLLRWDSDSVTHSIGSLIVCFRAVKAVSRCLEDGLNSNKPKNEYTVFNTSKALF